jgi:hypothetical protein
MIEFIRSAGGVLYGTPETGGTAGGVAFKLTVPV